ncbi:hypothetical protein B7760_04244 [Burkholderia glumae]|nr:hypothetical protein B7760_04244 [Burkholderia glumae]QKM56829.1 hypothetical protein CG017_04896 [Burkholderia glumae]QTP36020.1 hypothetical protein B7759_04655 [Burkholderia glumae]
MRSRTLLDMHDIARAAVVLGAGLGIGMAALPAAHAAPTAGALVDQAQLQAEAAAQADWRENVRQFAPQAEGCYHASYPNLKWNKVACGPVSGYRSARPNLARLNATRAFRAASQQVVGNGTDYSIQAPAGALISAAVGSFPSVSGVRSEKGVNAPFGSGQSNGITGANQYTLQLNTNLFQGSAACNGYSGCFAWQQYILVSDDVNSSGTALTGTSDVFIQTWLINYGQDVDGGNTNICPSGYTDAGQDQDGDDCYRNSPSVVVAKQLPITALASLKLSGSATTNGTDTATVTYGTQAYSSSVKDNVSDIANGWTQAEFNVVGNAGGSRADFNSGSSLTVKVAVNDGSTAAPSCVGPSSGGTTGETNNLTLGKCTASAGSGSTSPSIQFTESN